MERQKREAIIKEEVIKYLSREMGYKQSIVTREMTRSRIAEIMQAQEESENTNSSEKGNKTI